MPRRTSDPGRKALSPLDYMLQVINDAKVSDQRRDRMARCAVQYLGPKEGADPEAVTKPNKGGRPALGDRPMTGRERMQRFRLAQRAKAAR